MEIGKIVKVHEDVPEPLIINLPKPEKIERTPELVPVSVPKPEEKPVPVK